MKKKKVVVIGGGTGTVAVLSGLRDLPEIDLSVIVSMTDDGGSNAVVRDEFGLLPLSDLRKSIIALAKTDNQLLRELFTYRFDKGNGLSGHTLGNLMMMALSDITGSEMGAVVAARLLFQVHGNVIPVTLSQTKLVAVYDTGKRVEGEHLIDEPGAYTNERIAELSLSPRVRASREAVRALREADYIIVGPGDLYTSTLANIIVDGVVGAIQASRGKIIFINNLMTKKGQTHGMKASNLVEEVTRYMRRTPDVVVLNKKAFAPATLKKYASHNEYPIVDDLTQSSVYRVIRADVVANKEAVKDKGDTLMRSLIRHDAKKLGKILRSLIQ